MARKRRQGENAKMSPEVAWKRNQNHESWKKKPLYLMGNFHSSRRRARNEAQEGPPAGHQSAEHEAGETSGHAEQPSSSNGEGLRRSTRRRLSTASQDGGGERSVRRRVSPLQQDPELATFVREQMRAAAENAVPAREAAAEASQRFTFFIVRPRPAGGEEEAPIVVFSMGEEAAAPVAGESRRPMLVYIVRRDGSVLRESPQESGEESGELENGQLQDQFVQMLVSMLNPLNTYEELLNLDRLFGTVHRGVSQELIDEQLKEYAFVEPREDNLSVDVSSACSICLDGFLENELMRKLPCEHVYHKACIDMWLTGHRNNCPLCRQQCVQV